MTQEFIYHIIPAHEWEQISKLEKYAPESLYSEGFIHFSFADQIDGVIKRYYQDAQDLKVIKVDFGKLQLNLKIEPVGGNESFPHLYGELNLEDVVGKYDIQKNENGEYYWVE